MVAREGCGELMEKGGEVEGKRVKLVCVEGNGALHFPG